MTDDPRYNIRMPGMSQAGFEYGEAADVQAWELAVLKPQVVAVQEWFERRFGTQCTADTAKEICEAVLGAPKVATRYIVLTRTQHGDLDAFGPFRGAALATKTAQAGYVGHAEGTTATVLPMHSPYRMKKGKK